jgi:hypothetical protein
MDAHSPDVADGRYIVHTTRRRLMVDDKPDTRAAIAWFYREFQPHSEVTQLLVSQEELRVLQAACIMAFKAGVIYQKEASWEAREEI